METAEIRRRWLTFFAERGHTVVPSASLISPDPSLLFTVAGMVPFIPYLTGRETPPYARATSVQKCVRTLDIEEVGRTTRHGTFFQMNGNFSFGDYFKEGAIRYAWELLTTSQDDGGYGFDPDTLWATVYEEDDEAFRLWQEVAGLPVEADPAPRPLGQLLVHRPARPGRSLLGDLRRPRTGLRQGRRPGRRRGPVPRGVEPRLHAVRDRPGPQQGGLPRPRRAAEHEHRHRHGPGAGGAAAAGRREPVRDRRGASGARPRRGAGRRHVRRRHGRRGRDRRPAARGGRPRPQRAHAHR